MSYYYDFVLPCEKRKKGKLEADKRRRLFLHVHFCGYYRDQQTFIRVSATIENCMLTYAYLFPLIFVAGLVPHLYFPIILQMSESVTSPFVQKFRPTWFLCPLVLKQTDCRLRGLTWTHGRLNTQTKTLSGHLSISLYRVTPYDVNGDFFSV